MISASCESPMLALTAITQLVPVIKGAPTAEFATLLGALAVMPPFSLPFTGSGKSVREERGWESIEQRRGRTKENRGGLVLVSSISYTPVIQSCSAGPHGFSALFS